MKQVVFLRDPITEERVTVLGFDGYGDYVDTIAFKVTESQTKFFPKIAKEPLRFQSYPFFLDITTENRTELINVTRIISYELEDKQIIIRAAFEPLDNLEFLKQITYQRWLYPNEE